MGYMVYTKKKTFEDKKCPMCSNDLIPTETNEKHKSKQVSNITIKAECSHCSLKVEMSYDYKKD